MVCDLGTGDRPLRVATSGEQSRCVQSINPEPVGTSGSGEKLRQCALIVVPRLSLREKILVRFTSS